VFCRNNTSGYNFRDGITLCGAQAYVLIYFVLAISLTWMCMSIELFMRIILGMTQTTEQYLPFFLPVIFGLPLIPTLIVKTTENVAFNSAIPICWTYHRTDAALLQSDMTLFFGPTLAISGIGFLTMSSIIIYIIFFNKGTDTLKTLRIPLLFIIMMLVNLLTLVYVRFYIQYGLDVVQDMKDYTLCAMSNFDGTNSFQKICGIRAHFFSVSTYNWFLFCFSGSGLFMSSIFMTGICVNWTEKGIRGVTQVVSKKLQEKSKSRSRRVGPGVQVHPNLSIMPMPP
jgi:hypothetical protein